MLQDRLEGMLIARSVVRACLPVMLCIAAHRSVTFRSDGRCRDATRHEFVQQHVRLLTSRMQIPEPCCAPRLGSEQMSELSACEVLLHIASASLGHLITLAGRSVKKHISAAVYDPAYKYGHRIDGQMRKLAQRLRPPEMDASLRRTLQTMPTCSSSNRY